jgi:two-component sensor histidine kinase
VHVRAEPLPGADSDIAATLYRVAREALANIVKHAQASTVDIDLTVDEHSTPPCVLLRVADDGVGIREGQLDRRAEGHLGLRLLIDRVADQGGELSVTPGPDGGTVALARVPVTLSGEPPVVPYPRPAAAQPGTPPGGTGRSGTGRSGTAAAGGDADRARADTTS